MKPIGWIAMGGIIVAAGVGAGAAFADRGERWLDGPGGMDRGYFDDDHDRGERRGRWRRWFRGDLTKDDALARARSRFARFDANGDGVIDRTEVSARLEQRMSRRWRGNRRLERRMLRIRRADADRDGKVTRAEFRQRAEERFRRGDLNGDGQISDPDLPPFLRDQDALKRDAGLLPGRRFAHGRRGHKHGRHGPRRGARALQMLRRANVNNDNVVTKDEVMAAVDKRFDRMDRNDDNALDPADADTFRKEMITYRTDRFLNRFDSRASGRVTRDAFLKYAEERFARRDLNGDGRITRDEVGGPRRGRWRERDDDDRPERGRGPQPDRSDSDRRL
ncbi:MAG: hypothetical protein AAGC70_17035 [Pseudomonadota bacterium]